LVHFQTLGSNAIGWVLSSFGTSCHSQSVILDSSHQHTSSQIYLNFVQTNREVYFGSSFLGIVAPLQFINQTFQSFTEIIETQIFYCDPLTSSVASSVSFSPFSSADSSTENCVDTPEGSALIPQNSSLFFLNYLLNSKLPDHSNATAPLTNRSEILIFIPYGESDYSFSEDDVFDEDYSEPLLSTWDWIGIALGIITVGVLLIGIIFFSRSMRKTKSEPLSDHNNETVSEAETMHRDGTPVAAVTLETGLLNSSTTIS
jgi:hypothetical protein